jgi:HAD superfamily hydrolase (TIGR01509 family)
VSDPPAAPFAGVAFDLDGVLVESEHLWEENWAAFAAGRGRPWLPEHTARLQGMSVPEWAAALAAHTDDADAVAVAETVIDGMIAALQAGRIELLPGSEEMVRAAAARVPVAVASSAPRRLIEAVLAAHGLRDRFGAVVSSEEVPRGKPSPDVYEEAARRLGVDPRRCLAVEDSSNGIRAAAAAGMTVVGLPNPTYPPKPDAIALCAKIAASTDEVRRELEARLPAPATSAAGASPPSRAGEDDPA